MSPANPSGTNTLALATSPYLRQHADNPVHWQQWTPQALAEAAARAVPILLSVGYAACHWCHVMAHESFDDDEVAAAMNAGFVCIKVDREERPDIDAVYMNATVALTGQGGWPMTCFLTPNGRPFFCGTYYPKAAFLQLLSAISETWRERRAEVEQASDHIAAELRSMASGLPGGGPEVAPELCDDAVAGVLREQDTAHGGFGGAPKFPPSALLEALMRHYERTRSPAALEAVARTGNAMARGGIYDQLGGGFARYSVDGAWVVPHFEKMLYDNALLLRAYAHWARRTGDPLARRVAAQTARFLLDELGSKAPADMFTSSLDADADGREGSTYVWTPVQLTEVLGGDDGRWAAEVFGVTEAGTFEHGTSVLQLPADPDDAARLDRVRAALLVARLARAQPARDDKVVTSWNGLAITALAEASVALDAYGGTVATGVTVTSRRDIPDADIVMLDLSPAAVLGIYGDVMPTRINRSYRRYRAGSSAFKVDFAIEGDVGWTNPDCRRAGTVHLGGTFAEIADTERQRAQGTMVQRPFVLVGQQYLADPSRSVGNINPIWAYAHVPFGYTGDATAAVIDQIERFAPGFRDRIVATVSTSTTELQTYNRNFIGGDIIGGANDRLQVIFRPRVAVDPYAIGVPGVYLCSQSAPPGAGIHGLCGYHAAESALRWLRKRR